MCIINDIFKNREAVRESGIKEGRVYVSVYVRPSGSYSSAQIFKTHEMCDDDHIYITVLTRDGPVHIRNLMCVSPGNQPAFVRYFEITEEEALLSLL